MVQEVLNHLIVLCGAMGIMGVAYFAWLISGVGNMAVKDTLKNWSWKSKFRIYIIFIYSIYIL